MENFYQPTIICASTSRDDSVGGTYRHMGCKGHHSVLEESIFDFPVALGSSQLPIGSMYGIFTYIYHKDKPNVGKYSIHGSYVLVSGYHPPFISHEVRPFGRGITPVRGQQQLTMVIHHVSVRPGSPSSE